MKTRITFLAAILVMVFSIPAYAESTIIESPNVNIVIDGEIGSYEDTPLIVNDRTMLPLRAVLVNLGVQDDDEHILWNADERSVTVVTEDKTIWLQVDNSTATINGEAMTLDVAPMIYAGNNRTYIPARFISEALGKKVVWDGSTTTVLITDAERHAEILAILEQSNSSAEAENYRFDMAYTMDMDINGEMTHSDVEMIMEMNLQQNAMYMDMNMDMGIIDGMPMIYGVETYQMPDITYTRMSLLGNTWYKSPTETDLITTAASTEDMETFAIEANDVVAAGLVIVDNPDEDVIHLQGNVFIDDLMTEIMAMSESDMQGITMTFNEYYINMTLNRETYEMVSMEGTMDFSIDDGMGTVTRTVADLFLTYETLSADYEIVVPEEVMNSAVDF